MNFECKFFQENLVFLKTSRIKNQTVEKFNCLAISESYSFKLFFNVLEYIFKHLNSNLMHFWLFQKTLIGRSILAMKKEPSMRVSNRALPSKSDRRL